MSRPMVLEVGAALFEDALDDEADELFGELHHVVEVGVGDFGLDHPELGEVAARFRFLGAEGWAEANRPCRAPWRWLRYKAGRTA